MILSTKLKFWSIAFTFQYFSHFIYSLRDERLNEVFETTAIFFEDLKLQYGAEVPSRELYKSIDKEIDDYMSKLKKSTLSRGKRQLDKEKDVQVFNGFKEIPGLCLHDAIDVTFFSTLINTAPRWFAAILNSTGIFLFEYNNKVFQPHAFIPIDFVKLQNGVGIKSHSCETTTLIVARTSGNDAQVVRLNFEEEIRVLKRVQTIEIPGATDATIWRGINKIYMAISTLKKIRIFVWRGEHFDEAEPTGVGAAKLFPFRTGSATHLLAIGESRASFALKFSLSLRRFVVAQRFSARAEDAACFHLEKGHDGEYLVAIASKHSTILYKQSKHRFVPFQEISGAERIGSLRSETTILLFLFRNGSVVVYQYDGWKFVELRAQISAIFDVRVVTLENEPFLALPFKQSHSEDKNSTKTNSWSFWSLDWQCRDTWTTLREYMKNWCEDRLRKVIEPVSVTLPTLKSPLKLQRGHIRNLRARQINGQSIEKLGKLTRRVNKLISDAKKQQEASERYISTKNSKFRNLEAGNLRVNCTSTCRAGKMKISGKNDIMDRIRWIDGNNQDYNFLRVKISHLNNFSCPIPDPKFKDVTISGLFNGIPFSKFAKNVLKVTGDQILTGSHTFDEMRVKNAEIGIEAASNWTSQEIVADEIRVNELVTTSGHFILPLNSDSKITMIGRLTILDAKMNKVPFIRGHVNGVNSKKLADTIVVMNPLEIEDDVTFANVTIREQITVKDFTRSSGKSYNEIISNSIPLDTRHLPVQLKFKNERLVWKNVTLVNFPYKWLTKNQSGNVIVTGHKNATKPVIIVEESTYDNLPDRRLPFRVCSSTAKSPGIWESSLVIDRGIGNVLRAENLLAESELSEIYRDSVMSVNEIPWELKNLTRTVNVKKANIENVEGLDYQGLLKSMARWVEPGHLKGPLKFDNLNVEDLKISGDLEIPLPAEVRSVETKANFYVNKLNGIDVEEFLKSLVKVDDDVSLTNVTFAGSLIAKEISASKTSFSLQEKLLSGYFGSKEVQGTFESKELILKNFAKLPSIDDSINIVIEGNVQLTKEPKIVNINTKNLNTLFENVWLTDRPVEISSEYVEFKNATFESNVLLLKSFDTPNLGPWKDIENRVLSKVKPQIITVDSTIKFIQAPNIRASADSRLKSNNSYLRDLELSSLKNNNPQIVTDKWEFEKLVVTGNFDLRGQINGLNFSKDIVRHDVEKNIVKGKTTVCGLKARNIDGLNFNQFAKRAFKKNNNEQQTVIVKGWKTFKSVDMKNVTVRGNILGRKIEDSLLKSSSQNLRGTKTFENSFTSPAIVTDGLVNDLKLQKFVERQLKKHAPLQIIKTSFAFENNVQILGNVTISGSYNGADLNNIKNDHNTEMVANNVSRLMDLAEGIKFALENRAFYWNELEPLEENSKSLSVEPPKRSKLYFDGLGLCGIRNISLHCDSGIVVPLAFESPNGSRILKVELVHISGIPLAVFITSDPSGGVFIFQYDVHDKKFNRIASLLVPDIVEGSLTTMMGSLWINLVLKDHSMILRKELWSDFRGWILPATETSLMSATPSNELLLFRNDGVWKLGGLAGPRHILSAALHGQIETFAHGFDYYVQLTDKNVTTLLKSRFIGN